jgi:hypothetical protein
MKKLQGWSNHEASRIFKSLKSEMEMILDQADITMMILKVPIESRSFDEVYNYSDLNSRTKCSSAINKEFNKANVSGGWKKISKSEMTDSR